MNKRIADLDFSCFRRLLAKNSMPTSTTQTTLLVRWLHHGREQTKQHLVNRLICSLASIRLAGASMGEMCNMI